MHQHFRFFVPFVDNPDLHVRCFTRLFLTFIGGKFGVSDWSEQSVNNK